MKSRWTRITKAFSPCLRAIDKLSFHVNERAVFSVLGPNGASKTTTIRILTTAISEETRLVGGHDVTRNALKPR